MTSRKQFWLAIALLGLVVASPWLWRRGRECWWAWRWWQEEARDTREERSLKEDGILWPFRLACSSSDPLHRLLGIEALDSWGSDVDDKILQAIRDPGIVQFPDLPSPGAPLGYYVLSRRTDDGGDPWGSWAKAHLDVLLADFQDSGVPAETRARLAIFLIQPGRESKVDPSRSAGEGPVLTALRKAMKDPDPEVRRGAAGAVIWRCRDHSSDPLACEMIVDAMKVVLDLSNGRGRSKRDEWVRDWSCENIARVLDCTTCGTQVERAHWHEVLEQLSGGVFSMSPHS